MGPPGRGGFRGSSPRASTAVHGVDLGPGEPESLVHPDGGDIVLVHVEHRLGHAEITQVLQSGQGERPAEPAALLGGIDPDHVDLPQAGIMHLGPVEAGHLAACFRDEEARRVEPRLSFSQFQVVPGPAALLGMLGEGPAVQAEPFVFIPAGHEGTQRPAGREHGLVQRLTQRPAHLPQGAETVEARRPGQRGGRGQVAVGPEAEHLAAGRGGELTGQRAPESLPPPLRVDHELAGHLALGRRRIQVGVARDLTVRGDDIVPAS